MSLSPALNYFALSCTILVSLAGMAVAQTAAPPLEQAFTQPAPKQTAIAVIAEKVRNANSKVRQNGDDQIYAAGYFAIKIADPVELAAQRDMFAMIAWHQAQSDLINSIYSTFEASSMFEMPGSPIESKFKDRTIALEKQIQDVEDKMRAALHDVDQGQKQEVDNELARVEGLKFTERANALLDGLIKRVDADYSPQKLAEQKDEAARKKAEALKVALDASKARLEQLQVQMKDLNAKMKDEKDRINTTLTTTASRVASLPLMGAVVVNNAESYINGEYQIALEMKWSKKNEKIARAILKGEVAKDDPVPGRSLADWLTKLNKGAMVGSRTFTDENGDIWFIGVGSYPTDGGGVRMTRAKLTASLSADRSLMFALLADAASNQVATEHQETSSSKLTGDETSYATSAAEALSAKIGKTAVAHKRILVDEPAINPATGEEVWVQVLAVNATSSEKALEDLRDTMSHVIDITRFQANLQGRIQGLGDAQAETVLQSKAIQAGAAAKSRQDMLPESKPATERSAPPAAGSGNIMDGSGIPAHKPGGLSTGGGYDD
nr:hypothetical protein [uncultured Rhodopila sp.]